MSDAADLGGDPACWAHRFDRPDLDTAAQIEELVRAFYRRAAMDDLLGPVFVAAEVDWTSHIPTVAAFWSWQLLGQRGYQGNTLRAHERLQAETPFTEAHYERWLELFVDTVDDRFAGPRAELAKARAVKMAAAMRRIIEAGGDDAAAPPVAPVDVTISRRP